MENLVNYYPETIEKKGDGYYAFGVKDNVYTKLIEVINASGVAKTAMTLRAKFILGKGIENPLVNRKINRDISYSLAFSKSAFIHIKRHPINGKKITKIIPPQYCRIGLNGDIYVNEKFGCNEFKKSDTSIYQPFDKSVSDEKRIKDNIAKYKGLGEVLVVKVGNCIDSDIYPITEWMAGFADLLSAQEFSAMDYEMAVNGMKINYHVTFIGTDWDLEIELPNGTKTTKRKLKLKELQETSGLIKNDEGFSNRFGTAVDFSEDKESAPIITPYDVKGVMESTINKRKANSADVLVLFGLHPVLSNYSDSNSWSQNGIMEYAISLANDNVSEEHEAKEEAFKDIFGEGNFTTIKIGQNATIT